MPSACYQTCVKVPVSTRMLRSEAVSTPGATWQPVSSSILLHRRMFVRGSTGAMR